MTPTTTVIHAGWPGRAAGVQLRATYEVQDPLRREGFVTTLATRNDATNDHSPLDHSKPAVVSTWAPNGRTNGSGAPSASPMSSGAPNANCRLALGTHMPIRWRRVSRVPLSKLILTKPGIFSAKTPGFFKINRTGPIPRSGNGGPGSCLAEVRQAGGRWPSGSAHIGSITEACAAPRRRASPRS